ncbi:sensor histidine kinase [Nonomuraea sp. NBC_01738]|uniref:sensor histidine kinase n=1 Tax=Nonomuraea sp. NBC_01738 TaxID=2976003 RepID=UPI002E0EC8FB|nr:sensor histidine kinase [Nonomuraea sp. NBC_01738]
MSLTYAGVVAVIAAVYFGLVELRLPGLVAALAAGALFHPVRLRLRRWLRLERDPYRLADRLSGSVQAASGPGEALASGAAARPSLIAAEGVEVRVGGQATVVDGVVGPGALEVPLVWHGKTVGRLLVAGPRPDLALVDMLARHLAEVAHAVQLTADLRRAHERLRATRDEERGRLLGVLDDGLGATLAGLVPAVEQADSDARLQRIRQQLTEAVAGVRDLVYGLHPTVMEPVDGPSAPPVAEVLEDDRPMPWSWRRRLVVVIAWAGGLLAPAAVGAASWMAQETNYAGGLQPIDPIGLVYPVAGAFLITYRPRLIVPWIMWSVGLTWALYEVTFCGVHWLWMFDRDNPWLPYVGWASIWTWMWPVMAQGGLLPLLFPDDRPPSRRWYPVLYAVLALTITHSTLMALVPDPTFEIYLPIVNPFGVEALGTIPRFFEDNIGLVMIPLCLLSVASIGFRYKAADERTRRQITWFMASMIFFMAFWVVRIAVQETVPGAEEATLSAINLFIAAGAPISLIAAVLRHRVYGIRVILNRTLVYATLAAVLGLGYTALILVGAAFSDDLGPVAGLVAALAVGAALQPVRLRLQGSVDRLLGVERDPYRAADRLSRSVQEADDPAEALATATAVVRWALRARGAGVEVDGELVVDGVLGERPRVVELAWQGEPVGRLLLSGAKQGREPQVVMAKHLAELAHAVRLAADLRRSRERIRATREAERRRLGRELHDGLGPALTGVTMTLDAARRVIDRDPDSAARLLTQVREGMSSTLVSVRELVAGLRPTILDDQGLVGALRAFARGSETVTAGELGELPPGAELAAYRIATEALNNARKHAGATAVEVRLERSPGELLVIVADEGRGLPAQLTPGVGLTSMRERAAEVGGSCSIGDRAGGGVEVRASLPL